LIDDDTDGQSVKPPELLSEYQKTREPIVMSNVHWCLMYNGGIASTSHPNFLTLKKKKKKKKNILISIIQK
jgi:hypothetical protein